MYTLACCYGSSFERWTGTVVPIRSHIIHEPDPSFTWWRIRIKHTCVSLTCMFKRLALWRDTVLGRQEDDLSHTIEKLHKHEQHHTVLRQYSAVGPTGATYFPLASSVTRNAVNTCAGLLGLVAASRTLSSMSSSTPNLMSCLIISSGSTRSAALRTSSTMLTMSPLKMRSRVPAGCGSFSLSISTPALTAACSALSFRLFASDAK